MVRVWNYYSQSEISPAIILAGSLWFTKVVDKGSADTERCRFCRRKRPILFKSWCWWQAHPSPRHVSILDCCSRSPQPYLLTAWLLSLLSHYLCLSADQAALWTIATVSPRKSAQLHRTFDLLSSMDLKSKEISLHKIFFFFPIYEMVILSRI